jgi:OmpA-OmpF porin, OOP family
MKKRYGLAVLAIGLAAIGLWGSFISAPRIEAQIRAAATAVLDARGESDVALTVSGRDIYVSGTSLHPDGAAGLIAALDGVAGRRGVTSDVVDLEIAKPFFLSLQHGAQGTVTGFVPSEAFRMELAATLGADSVSALPLARGAPEGWQDIVRAGLAVFAQLSSGRVTIEGQTLLVAGEVPSPIEAAAVDAALANVAMVIKDITVLDDGQPIAYTLTLDGAGAAVVRGKLPMGVQPADIARALGLPRMGGDAVPSRIGDGADMGFLTAWAAVLPAIEELRAEVSPSARSVFAKLRAGADVGAVTAALQAGGFTATVQETAPPPPPPPPAAPAVPVSPLGFEIMQAGCQGAVDTLLAQSTIIFLPNLDALEPSAAPILENLAAIARDCAGAGLRAEIGGHTDTSGDADENLALSARRAQAVLDTLAAMGVPPDQMTATGYGSAQPISENETPEGRAKNRRTTITWAQ